MEIYIYSIQNKEKNRLKIHHCRQNAEMVPDSHPSGIHTLYNVPALSVDGTCNLLLSNEEWQR